MVKSGLFDMPLRTGHLSERPFLYRSGRSAFVMRDAACGQTAENKKPALMARAFLNRRCRQII